MSNLTLNCSFSYNMTFVPNEFLDRFMPHANGEFVKVYLQLLRLAATGKSYTLPDVADMLSCTEKDVARALRYWEKAGVLRLDQDESGEITGVTFSSVSGNREIPADPADGTAPSGTGSDVRPADAAGDTKPADAAADTKPENAASDAGPADTAADMKPADTDRSGSNVPKRRQLTASRITQLEDTEDFMYLLFVSGQYLGRNLTRTDIDTLGYFYDELHMPVDLIEYLIEYCVSNSHTSIRYIETVGLAWHSEGIQTVEQAKESGRKYQKEYYTIFKALGIRNHSPISAEIQLMDKWMKTYQFSMDLIQEACTRTIMQTSKPTLAYADGILTSWFKENIHTLEDVRSKDEVHRLKQSKETDQKTPSRGKDRKPSGSFYNFEQRSYDSDLESRLLGIPSDNK